MNDCDDVDFSDSPFPPWAKKRKKNDDGKCAKVKKKKTDKKKKKISKFKAAMVEKKEKKKKKKNKPGDGFTLTPTSDRATQKPAEKRKRKKVAFDLSDVKRPKFASSSSSPLDVDVADSQRNSDDVNSQDLFITQKTFRTPPSQTSDKTESPEETASKKNDASTQTENFFTAEMTSFLDFCRKRNEATRESLQPMDLSAGRATGDVGRRRRPCWGREVEEKGEEPGRRSGRSQEAKCVDATTSSDDNDGKTDLTQGRVVQTRLNESFFFKTKGDGEKTRPESPLLKLTQGRDVGGNKRRH